MADPKLKAESIQVEDFFDKNGQLNHNLISDAGQNSVIDLIDLLREKVENYNPQRKRNEIINSSLNINQLRKFYDNFLRVFYSKQSVNEKKVQLIMLMANAEYSANRLKVYRFAIYIKNRVNILLKKNDTEFDNYLNAFKLQFEALVGYFPKN